MKKRILIVEDDPVLAHCLKGSIIKFGYSVSTVVDSGEAAIQEAFTNTPDLVLIDITLNGPMDGIEATEKIRAHCDIPVIYLTSHSEADILQKAKQTGPFGYIVKPHNARELEVVLAAAFYKYEQDKILRGLENRCNSLCLAKQSANKITQQFEEFKHITIEREDRMIELKTEINQLCIEMGRPAPYPAFS